MDIQKQVRDCSLYDIYGELLTDRQREALDMHLNLDYSLAEIAEIQNISRQAALDSIRRAMARLEHFEKVLRLYERYTATMNLCDELETAKDGKDRKETVDRIRGVWEDL